MNGLSGKPTIAVLDVLPPDSRSEIRAQFDHEFEVVFAEGGADQRVAIAERATGLLVIWETVDARIIEATRRCRVIQKLGVGVEKIDTSTAHRKGIVVLRAAGSNAVAVAEMTVLLTLAALRRLIWAAKSVEDGRWVKEDLRRSAYQLAGRTIGLIGMGHIGRATARRFASFDTHLAYYDVRRLPGEVEQELSLHFAPLDELIAMADILSLHLPLTPETVHLVDSEFLARIRPGAILVNTARGGLVDEQALTEALRSGLLGGAALDVTEQEPLPTSSALLKMQNVVITPHCAAAVADNFRPVVRHAYQNVVNVLAGRAVSPEDIVSIDDRAEP